MLRGTTIDELIETVERAEEHARQMQMREEPLVVEFHLPRLAYDMPPSQPMMIGVA